MEILLKVLSVLQPLGLFEVAMGRNVKKHISWEGKKLLTTIKGKEVRVAFDGGYGKNGGYRLYVDNEKVAQSNSKKKIAKLYYDYIDENKTLEFVYQYSWRDKFKDLQDKYPEKFPRIDLSKITSKQVMETYMLFFIYAFGRSEEQILKLLSSGDFKLFYIPWDKGVLNSFIDFLDEAQRCFVRQKMGKEQIEIPPIKIQKKQQSYLNLRVDELYKIDKDYIIQEFVKLLKKDKHSVAALAGIPELAHLDEVSETEKETDKD